ncbi:MAG: threonine--tRNA ligase [Planctomycetota bacterium]|jgi:threonyl-tRNA synthetase|nr:threonine--tRNA ligase [Planctomycetota bacterium]
MPKITLPDNSVLDFSTPVLGKEIAERIGAGLAKAALAISVNGELRDLTAVVNADATVAVITPSSPEALALLRHSASHVLAEAVARLFPGTKFAYGPAVDDGFYYDIDPATPLTADDLPRLEKEMAKIVKENTPFVRRELTRAEALAQYAGDEYKTDNINRAKGDVLSFYEQGAFSDLCRGPHVPSAGKIGHFKVLSLAGAYWHGDNSQKQLTRVYGTTFATKEELEKYLRQIEEAKKRDHRVLGKQLGLYEFHAEAPGMAFWRHNGVVLRNTFINFLRELCYAHDYEEFLTPQILNRELWEISGHWENYADKMYVTTKDGRDFGVKPMNCPGAVLLYKAGLYSHNDLPLRWAEFGHVHRYEGSGEIHGLIRVRGFTQDDAHIFCAPAQLEDEIAHCIEFIFKVYTATLGMKFDHIELSTRPPKSVGTDEMWANAEAALENALKKLNIAFKLNPGDGAFYGPKIDFHVADAIGRTWQMGTIQVDFSMPERFDLHYVDENSQRQRPVMIHRAISGSIERFLGVLTEHFAGDFPLWLAPEQARILPISDAVLPYAREVKKQLAAAGLRVTVDGKNEKIGAKIRRGELAKTPYLIVIGAKEAEAQTVAARRRVLGDLGEMTVAALTARLTEEAKTRALPPSGEVKNN